MKTMKIIQDLYALKKIIQGIKEVAGGDDYIDGLVDDAYSIVINLIGELEEE